MSELFLSWDTFLRTWLKHWVHLAILPKAPNSISSVFIVVLFLFPDKIVSPFKVLHIGFLFTDWLCWVYVIFIVSHSLPAFMVLFAKPLTLISYHTGTWFYRIWHKYLLLLWKAECSAYLFELECNHLDLSVSAIDLWLHPTPAVVSHILYRGLNSELLGLVDRWLVDGSVSQFEYSFMCQYLGPESTFM